MNTALKQTEIDYTKLQEELESKYSVAIAQDIIDQLRKSQNATNEPEYMDVKTMSELVEKFRAQANLAIWRMREWRQRPKANRYQVSLIDMEGVFLERQCRDAIKLYREANTTYFAMFRRAMAAVKRNRWAVPPASNDDGSQAAA